MCYFFKLACGDTLHKQIDKVGTDKYFIVCIEDNNYLYCSEEATEWKIRKILSTKHILLKVMTPATMKLVLDEPYNRQHYELYGNKILYENFYRA
ncbi:MAG: hypothetical protein QM726_21335 [Chitinophagaceae bacterium]